MFEPAVIDHVVYQGATFRKLYSLTTGTPPRPFDLTGFKGRAQLRPSIDSDEVIATLTTENGGFIIEIIRDDNDAIVECRWGLYMGPAQTAAFDFKKCVYDAELEDAVGDVGRIAKGEMELDKEVTRA